MKSFIFFIIWVGGLVFGNSIKDDDPFPVDEDWGLSIYEFLDKYGYGHEEYSVTTEDGYILLLQRIISSKTSINEKSPKPVVFLMHGLECSAFDFINNGPDSALALLLADKGYDVWLGNNRGNTYSRNHSTLSPDDRKFWLYSFHEIGTRDLSTMIDHVLEYTGVKQLTYVGHSQGTTTFFALTAYKPEYNDKINLMVALAPVAYLQNASHPVLSIIKNPLINLILGAGIEVTKFYNIIPHWDLITQVGKYVCYQNSTLLPLCAIPFYVMGGYNPDQLDNNFIPVIISSAPAGTSYMQIMHFLQLSRSGYFRQFDYGLLENKRMYGQTSPPIYDTSKITAPVALFYAENDYFTSVADVERLASELPNVVLKKQIELKDFTHLDFIWAIDINKYVNDDVIQLIDQYNEKATIY